MVALLGKAVAVAVRLISLSIIVPILNEEQSIDRLSKHINSILDIDKDIEIIFVDGGSEDATVAKLEASFSKSKRVKLLHSKAGRATQMNAGANQSQGEWLLFLHADTLLPQDFYYEIFKARPSSVEWGRFNVELNSNELAFLVISFFINWRSRITGIATGDQAIFVRRKVFASVGKYPNQQLMEDIELSKRLKTISKPYCSKKRVITSARRWQKHGVVKTVLLMWSLRYAYFRGAEPELLHQKYYKNS